VDLKAIVDAISLAEHEFTLETAETPELLHEVFRLRYQVYCVERGFEPGESGIEMDEFDANSRHIILRHARDGAILGTVRVVAPNLDDPDNCFPMQRVADPTMFRHLPLATTGEVSRFAISKERRMTCTSAALLRLSLFRGVMQLSDELGLTHWCAVMERSLLRLLQASAIHMQPVGPLVSYHGFRQPSTGHIASILQRLRREQYPVWEFVTNGGQYCPATQSRLHFPMALAA
jgi:N-acyl-L-homoserine lactone synthetase